MLSGISHDLRTPLTRMKLQTAFIKDKSLANKLVEDTNYSFAQANPEYKNIEQINSNVFHLENFRPEN